MAMGSPTTTGIVFQRYAVPSRTRRLAAVAASSLIAAAAAHLIPARADQPRVVALLAAAALLAGISSLWSP